MQNLKFPNRPTLNDPIKRIRAALLKVLTTLRTILIFVPSVILVLVNLKRVIDVAVQMFT